MLPYTSCSCWALVALALRWAFASSRYGGLSKDSHRSASAAFLQSLLRCALPVEGQALTIQVELLLEWVPLWPAPPQQGAQLPLDISDDGTCKLEGFAQRACMMPKPSGKPCWWKGPLAALVKGCGLRPQLLEVLRHASNDKNMQTFYGQLLWGIGSALQAVVVQASRGAAPAHGLLEVALKSTAKSLDDNLTMDRQLVAYQNCCRQRAAPHSNFSCCTDKASVCGLGSGLQSTIFVLPTNEALVAAPQVSCFRARRGWVSGPRPPPPQPSGHSRRRL